MKINYQNNNGENLLENNNIVDKKNLSTDTDYYYNKLVNPNKIIFNKKNETESSEILNVTNSETSLKQSMKGSTTNSESNKSAKSNKSTNSIKSINSNNSNKSNSESRQRIEQIPIFFNQSNKQSSLIQNTQPSSMQQPTMQQPSMQQPTMQQPTMQQPTMQQPTMQQPSMQQPSMQQPSMQQPSMQNIPPLQKEIKQLTQQEIRMKKIEMLRRLSEIKSKGYNLSKEYDFNSSLDEMEYEYELLKSFADKRIGVKMYKNILLQSVSVIEFLNDKYDPFNFHLTGWSEHLSIETDNWDDTWEEIYEKYKSSGRKMSPEIKLLYLMIASASAFHFSKAHTSKLLGLDSVLASNPGLLSKIINPAKKQSQFMSPQEINIEKQKEELKNKEYEAKINAQKQQELYINQLQEQIKKQQSMLENYNSNSNINANNFNEMWESTVLPQGWEAQKGPHAPSNMSSLNNQQTILTPNNQQNNQLPPTQSVSEFKNKQISIKAPEQVNAILNRIHNIQASNVKNINTDTQDETSSNERLVSDTTLSDSKKKVRKTKPKSSIIIN